jgi:hypothetical protein
MTVVAEISRQNLLDSLKTAIRLARRIQRSIVLNINVEEAAEWRHDTR